MGGNGDQSNTHSLNLWLLEQKSQRIDYPDAVISTESVIAEDRLALTLGLSSALDIEQL